MDISILEVYLISVLILAIFYDIRFRKIPNVLTFPAILIGLIYNVVFNGFNGFLFGIFGFLIGLGLFFIPFALGLMGAGDVKLMGAIGALMGWKFTMIAALFSSIAGILVAIIYLIYKKQLLRSLKKYVIFIMKPIAQLLYYTKRTKTTEQLMKFVLSKEQIGIDEKLYVPYGLAIALGTLFTLSGIFKEYLFF